MIRFIGVLLSFAALFAACSRRPSCEESVLVDEGIVGNWEIYQRTDAVTMFNRRFFLRFPMFYSIKFR